MERKDYYKILGIDKNASQEEIKKSYRALCLSLHPDRQVGKSEAEKKEAEEKFKEVSEAYDTLSDPAKKRRYDSRGSEAFGGFEDFFRDMGGGYDPFMGHTDPFGFSDIFGERSRRRNGPRPEDFKGKDIRMNIPLTVEDIVNGCKKKVRYKRQVRCHVCHGKGGENRVTCPYCHGTGFETEVSWHNGMRYENSHTCTHCHGKGYKMEKPCRNCNETGFETREETLDIAFQPGIGSSVTMYSQKGNESRDENGVPGSFIAVPVIDVEKLGPQYDIDGLDIIENIKVKISDALLGKEIEIKVPGQRPEKHKLSEGTKPGDHITKYGLGILSEDFEYGKKKRGNYVFVVQYDLPTKLTDKQRLFIEKLAETGL